MAHSLYPALRVLCLSDMKSPVMDKLLFFARQMDRFLPKYLSEAEAIGKKFCTEEVIKIMNDALEEAPPRARANDAEVESDDSDSNDSDGEESEDGDGTEDEDSSADEDQEWQGESLVY